MRITQQIKYTRWKICTLKEKQYKSSKFWQNKCISKCKIIKSLRTQIQTLQKEAKATDDRSRCRQLDKSQNGVKQQILTMDNTKASFDHKENAHQKVQEKLENRLKTSRESNQSLTEASHQKEFAIKTNVDERLALQKDKAAKYECEIVDMKDPLDQIEGEKKSTVDYLHNQRAKKNNLKQSCCNENKTGCGENRGACTLTEKKLEKQVQQIKDLGEALAQLKVTIRAKNKLLAQKNREIEKLNMAVQTSQNLNESNQQLRNKVKTTALELKKVKAEVRSLETYQMRFKEDLQGCISVIGDKKALQKRIIYLKSRYADNNASVKMDPGTKSVFENEFSIHSGCSERIQKELDEANKQLEATTDCLEKTRGFLIQLMNEQILELNKLKKELETFKNQEEKSKWSSREKMKSWINKKVLRSFQVAPLFDEALPSLYPLDWQTPADVSTSEDDLFSSSPQDCMDERITYVMPFVDDEL